MITNLLDADMIEFRENMDKDWDRMVFWQEHPKLNFVWDKIQFCYHKLIYLTLCRRGWNCDIEMEGEATPDTGWESWWCKRCGRGGTHYYY